MAQDITQKQANFARRYQSGVQQLANAIAALNALKAEWDAMGYAAGAPAVDGVNYNLTDAVVQAAIPAATAADLDSAVGGVASVITTFNSNAGYLYPILP